MNVLRVYEQIESERIISIVRRSTQEDTLRVCKTLFNAGVRVMELPFTMQLAHRRLEAAATALPEALIGAGTILDAESARIAVLSGARFMVTPTINKKVIEIGNRYGVPVFPGVHSPTEALYALEAGCLAVKLFPASEFSPETIGAWKTPLVNLEVIPTGGIGPDNAKSWLRAGAYALGMGASLCGGTEEDICRRVKKLHALIAEVGKE